MLTLVSNMCQSPPQKTSGKMWFSRVPVAPSAQNAEIRRTGISRSLKRAMNVLACSQQYPAPICNASSGV
jgi:hypothetical protein